MEQGKSDHRRGHVALITSVPFRLLFPCAGYTEPSTL